MKQAPFVSLLLCNISLGKHQLCIIRHCIIVARQGHLLQRAAPQCLGQSSANNAAAKARTRRVPRFCCGLPLTLDILSVGKCDAIMFNISSPALASTRHHCSHMGPHLGPRVPMGTFFRCWVPIFFEGPHFLLF